MGSQLQAVNTPATAAQVMGALAAAMGTTQQEAVAIVAGQSAVETANWGGGLWNYNLGNLTASSGQNYVMQGSLSLHFQAFDSLTDGAAAMVAWLSSRGALPYALNGDLAGYVAALAKGCYLGCIGNQAQQSDGSTRAVTQQDYNNYQAGIQARINSLGLLTIPIPQGNSLLPAVAAAAAIAAGGAILTYLIHREGWRLAL
jgi:hypothetical protein